MPAAARSESGPNANRPASGGSGVLTSRLRSKRATFGPLGERAEPQSSRFQRKRGTCGVGAFTTGGRAHPLWPGRACSDGVRRYNDRRWWNACLLLSGRPGVSSGSHSISCPPSSQRRTRRVARPGGQATTGHGQGHHAAGSPPWQATTRSNGPRLPATGRWSIRSKASASAQVAQTACIEALGARGT